MSSFLDSGQFFRTLKIQYFANKKMDFILLTCKSYHKRHGKFYQSSVCLLLLTKMLRLKMLENIVEVFYSLLLIVYHMSLRFVKLFIPQKMLEKNISGQVVLVTGGGSGIGRLMCLRFARLGATVVTWDINKAGNQETADMVNNEGNKAFPYTVDMSSK